MGQLSKIDATTAWMPPTLQLEPTLPFDEWVSIGRNLFAAEQAFQWHIGDWWRFGVQHYGEASAKQIASEIWGVEGETARVYGWVAEKFSTVTRVTDLPFSHYKAVASVTDEQASMLIDRAVREGLSVRDLRREVQAIKAANDAPIGTVSAAAPAERKPKPEWPAIDILATKYVEAMDEISSLREMTKGEADFCAMIEQCLGEEYSDRKPVPDDFEIIFVEKGRPACEPHYGASRITISRWMHQTGYSRLIRERANFVKYQRDQQRAAEEAHKPVTSEADSFLPVATMAADFLRTNRYGGWRISRQASGWIVGTVHRTSEELIAMAERQGFDREAAVTEARQEGY